MKLRVVSNLSQRPINNLEILFKFVFGDKFPSIFEPYKVYKKGDVVFIIDENGNPKVLQCLVPGSYDSKEDVLNSENWGEITVSDVVTGGTIEEIQKVVGNLNEYIGNSEGEYSNVVEITNALYNKVENLINNFPEHDSEIDGGYFLGYDPDPEEPEVPTIPTEEQIKEHDNTPYAHQTIVIDGNIYGDTVVEEIDTTNEYRTNSILTEHNNNPNAHDNIIIDGNV